MNAPITCSDKKHPKFGILKEDNPAFTTAVWEFTDIN